MLAVVFMFTPMDFLHKFAIVLLFLQIAYIILCLLCFYWDIQSILPPAYS